MKQRKNNTYFIVPLIFVSFSIFLVYEPNTNEFGIPSYNKKRKDKHKNNNTMIRSQTSKTKNSEGENYFQ